MSQWVSKWFFPFNLISGHLHTYCLYHPNLKSLSLTIGTERVIQQTELLMQVRLCSSTAYRNISFSIPHMNWKSDFFSFLLTAKHFPLSLLNVVTSVSKEGSAHTLKSERVHSGHLSLPSLWSGSLPLRFFSKTNLTSPILSSTWPHPTCFSGYSLNCRQSGVFCLFQIISP